MVNLVDLRTITVECPRCRCTVNAVIIQENPPVWQGICKGCRRYEKWGVKRLTAKESDQRRGQ